MWEGLWADFYTVKPPINRHSKRRTPLISGQFYFPRPFPSQILIKKFPKGGYSISGQIFLHRMAQNAYFILFASLISGHWISNWSKTLRNTNYFLRCLIKTLICLIIQICFISSQFSHDPVDEFDLTNKITTGTSSSFNQEIQLLDF